MRREKPWDAGDGDDGSGEREDCGDDTAKMGVDAHVLTGLSVDCDIVSSEGNQLQQRVFNSPQILHVHHSHASSHTAAFHRGFLLYNAKQQHQHQQQQHQQQQQQQQHQQQQQQQQQQGVGAGFPTRTSVPNVAKLKDSLHKVTPAASCDMQS
jgi:hypothetical protein